MTDHALVEKMRAVEFDQAAAGDLEGAHMMGDIIEGYVGGWVAEGTARMAVTAGRNRISSRAGGAE